VERRAQVKNAGKSLLFGVLGAPVDHSLSPAMMRAAFAARRLPHVYLRFPVAPDALRPALREAARLGAGGLNLTVPLKEAAVRLVDDLTPEARAAGAVNTILFRGAGAIGHNTDGNGFLRSLRGRVRLRGARVVVLGAGGSARAVGTALLGAGCAHLTVVNRTPARAEALAQRLRRPGGADIEVRPCERVAIAAALEEARLVVNTTSTGLGAERLPVRAGTAPRACLFVDLVYGRRPTPFLQGAARAGRPTMDGAGMLLHQGALAFEAWTGRPAPVAAMHAALRAAGLALPHPTATRRGAA
jgi:shikimate dehydrogenase